MDTSHTICHQCKRESFSEETAVVRCPYCGSKRIETSIVPNQSDVALSVMGFDKLSEEQKAIVLSTEGINYVEAGPGTAKSTSQGSISNNIESIFLSPRLVMEFFRNLNF